MASVDVAVDSMNAGTSSSSVSGSISMLRDV